MYATIIPVFFWLFCGVATAFCAIRNQLASRLLIGAWLAGAMLLGDSPQNILRQLLPPDRTWVEARNNAASLGGHRVPIRIVSLNCMRDSTSVSKLALLRPDVVLLQETAPSVEMQELLTTHFLDYSFASSGDASMLVRGEVVPIETDTKLAPSCHFALVKLDSGVQFHAVSLHLIHSPRIADFWNVETWRTFSDLSEQRRRELIEIRAAIGETIGTGPTIIGGDFNAPAGDTIFETLKPSIRDGWAAAGRGWGKTSLNDYPIHRIDQIWSTSHFEAVSVVAKDSEGSDHRMVIFDAWLPRSSE